MFKAIRIKRLAAFLLILTLCFCLMIDACQEHHALAEIYLPPRLTTLDSETFAGNYRIEGVVELPETVTMLGENVFAGTQLYGLKTPVGLANIPAQGLDGTAYVYVDSLTTTASSGAFKGVTYVFGYCDGKVKSQAEADGAIFVCFHELREENGFYYKSLNGEATLICAVDGTAVSGEVTVPLALSDGTPVTRLARNAMVGCDGLNLLRLPRGITEDAGCFDGCPNAVVGYYSDSEFCVTSMRADQQSVNVGSNVTWIARTNSKGAVEYYFEVLKKDAIVSRLVSRSDNFRSSLLYADSNSYTMTMTEPGSYIASVTCRDENGVEVTESATAVTVLPPCLELNDVTVNASAPREGENLTWTVETSGGIGEILYSYTLQRDGKTIDTMMESTSATYTLSNAPAGEYSLIVTVGDEYSQPPAYRANPVMVYSAAQAKPAAPVLRDTVLSTTQANAPVIEAQSIALKWDEVPFAAQYGVTVSLWNGTAWSEVLSTTMSGSKIDYTVSAALFADLAADTLCRISLYSVNLEVGESNNYYVTLQPHVVDTSLTINGETAVYWYEGYYGAAAKSFTINSELPWTVTPKNGGDWYSYTIQGDTLTVNYHENNLGAEQDERLQISNGVSTATLYLRHYYCYQPPFLSNPLHSHDPNAPAHAPMDLFECSIAENENTVAMYIDAQSGDGWSPVWSSEKVEDNFYFSPRAQGLKADTLYRVRLVGYRYSLEDSVETDALTSIAYVMFDEAPVSVLIGGSAAHSISMPGSGTYDADLKVCGGEPVITSDASWLSYELASDHTYLSVMAEENTTASVRTGHITVDVGNQSAVLTVNQDSNLPRLMMPSSLSTSQSSPTTVYLQEDLGWNAFRAECEVLTLSVLENGSFTEVATDKDDDGACMVNISYEDVAVGSTYRLSITQGSTTVNHYLKFAEKSSYYIYVNGDDTDYLRIDGAGGSEAVTLEAAGSWKASCSDSWLSVSAASGSTTSSKTITIKAQPNNTGILRRGQVTFARGSYQQATVIVEQYPVADALSISWDGSSGIFGGAGNGKYVYIDTNGSWKATVTADWLGFDKACTTKSTSDKGVGWIKLYCTVLPAGSAPRKGIVTVQAGSVTRTLEITQMPTVSSQVTSPVFSSSKTEPSIFEHDDLVVTWKGDQYAAYYTVTAKVRDYENSLSSVEHMVQADGSATYSLTIPKDWMRPDTDYVCTLCLKSYDIAGNSNVSNTYFQVVSGDGVFLDGKSTKRISEASDLGDEASVIVTSTGAWRAETKDAWITLDKNSGVNGDKLTLTVAKNYGAERDGIVTVTSGGKSAELHVSQCAFIPDAPLLKDCSFSLDMAAPTVIDNKTTSITVNWEKEEQPTYYQLRLYEIHTTSMHQHHHAASMDDTLIYTGKDLEPRDRTHTIEGLTLKPGALYMLDFYRTISDRRTQRTHYYFMASTEGKPYVYIYDDSLAETEEFYSTEDHSSYTITSNGTWRAVSDSDWLMVGNEGYTWAELIEEDNVPEDFNTYTALDDRLVISTLANETGKTRKGKVTVSIPGGNKAVITIVQPRSCTAAVLTSPALTNDKENTVTLPYGDVRLNWTASPDGAGRYTVDVREKLPDETRFYDFFEKTVTGTSVTIPVADMTSNAEYIVYLDTWVDDSCTVRKTYRFRLGYENALSVVADVRWSDGRVSVSANASGGSGSGYRYHFVLLRNGEIENNSLWFDGNNEYSFTFSGAGTYQMKVWVGDDQGQETSFIVSEHVVGESAAQDYISLNQKTWMPAADGGELTLDISASNTWNVTSDNWLSVQTVEGVSSRAVVTAQANSAAAARVGKVIFTCGSTKATLTVTQPGIEITGDDSSISLSRGSWTIVADSANSINVKVTATGDWAVTESPAWVSLSATSGSGEQSVTLYAAANSGASREGTLTLQCGSAQAKLTIQQMGNDVLPMITSFEMSETSVTTGIPVTFTVEAANADRVVLVVDNSHYEEHMLTGGKATFTRAFSSSGERNVQMLPLRGNTEGVLSAAQTLSVTSIGSLASALLEDAKPILIGGSVTVNWQPVENAEEYVIYLSCGGRQVWKTTLEADTTSITLGPDVLSTADSYTFLLMATAAGYKQSESSMFIDVMTPKTSFSIVAPTAKSVYIPKDMVDIIVNNPDGYNLAVKVTDESGVVSWLPADGGTANDTYIKGKFLWSPTSTGAVTIQVMGWSTEERTAESNAWYNTKKNVTFTVNGPIARMIYLNGYTSASALLTSQLTEMKVKTNNAVIAATMYVDDVQIADVTAWDSEVNYVRTFSCQLPAATEGLHRYKVVVRDDAGRTQTRQYTLYLVTPAAQKVKYASKADVLLRSTPEQTAAKATKLETSTALTVQGTYKDSVLGDLYYVKSSQGNGFVVAAETSDTQLYDPADAHIIVTAPSKKEFTYIGGDSIQLSWTSSVPDHVTEVYNIYKQSEGSTTWQLVASTTGTDIKISPNMLKQGTWRLAIDVTIKYQDYGRTIFPYEAVVCGDVNDYLDALSLERDDESMGYSLFFRGAQIYHELSVTAHEAFTIGTVGPTGEFIPPIDIREMVESDVYKFYTGAFGNAIPADDDMVAQLKTVQSVMNSLAPADYNVPGKKAYEGATVVLKFLDFNSDMFEAILPAMDKLFNVQNSSLDNIGEVFKMINVNDIEKFSNAKDGADIFFDFCEAFKMAVRFMQVDDKKLEEIANGFLLCTDNANMVSIGNMLLEMRSPINVAGYCFGMFEFDVAKFIKGKIGETVGDFVKSLGWVGKLYMFAMDGALAFNDVVLNISEINEAAYELYLCVEMTDDYLPTFKQAWKDFKNQPMEYYETFVRCCSTYYKLLDAEYKALHTYCKKYNEAGWNKLIGIFSKKDDRLREALKKNEGFADELKQRMRENLNGMYTEAFAYFGVSYYYMD